MVSINSIVAFFILAGSGWPNRQLIMSLLVPRRFQDPPAALGVIWRPDRAPMERKTLHVIDP